jgi:hypothetical protein
MVILPVVWAFTKIVYVPSADKVIGSKNLPPLLTDVLDSNGVPSGGYIANELLEMVSGTMLTLTFWPSAPSNSIRPTLFAVPIVIVLFVPMDMRLVKTTSEAV